MIIDMFLIVEIGRKIVNILLWLVEYFINFGFSFNKEKFR